MSACCGCLALSCPPFNDAAIMSGDIPSCLHAKLCAFNSPLADFGSMLRSRKLQELSRKALDERRIGSRNHR
ncbi:hypothetical protein V6N13_057037 [Hibiscus sabdariffa]